MERGNASGGVNRCQVGCRVGPGRTYSLWACLRVMMEQIWGRVPKLFQKLSRALWGNWTKGGLIL